MIPTWNADDVPPPHVVPAEDLHRSQVPPSIDAPGHGPVPTAQGVRGYRDLDEETVAVINSIKEMETTVATAWATVVTLPGVDYRWLDLARQHLQTGFSELVRSIAQPVDPFDAKIEARAQAVEHRRAEAVAAAERIGQNGIDAERREQAEMHRQILTATGARPESAFGSTEPKQAHPDGTFETSTEDSRSDA